MPSLGLKFDFDADPDILTIRFLEDEREFIAFDMPIEQAEAFFKDALEAVQKRLKKERN